MGAVRLWLPALLLASLAAVPTTARGGDWEPMDRAAALERSEAAVGNEVGNHVLTNSRGEPLPLAGFRGRPLLISVVYTSCSSVCPATTQNLFDRVREARRIFGEDAFAVLSVGFDARGDTPARLRAFAATQGINDRTWNLATADAETLDRLLDELGFSYVAAAGGFFHVAQTTVLDADSRVYRQIYGDEFPLPVLVEPLKALMYGSTARMGSVEDLIDRVRFLCTVYNPSTGAYEFEYAYFLGMGVGGFSLVVTGWIVFGLRRGNRRSTAAQRVGDNG